MAGKTVRPLLLTLALALGLALPASASARVRLIHVTSPTSPGSYATLTAFVSPSRTCSITVYYKSGPSHAQACIPRRLSAAASAGHGKSEPALRLVAGRSSFRADPPGR
jgi:hypothetical protein